MSANQYYHPQQQPYPQQPLQAYGQGYQQPQAYGPQPGYVSQGYAANNNQSQMNYQPAPRRKNGALSACLALLCCCCVAEEGCEACADCGDCLEGCC